MLITNNYLPTPVTPPTSLLTNLLIHLSSHTPNLTHHLPLSNQSIQMYNYYPENGGNRCLRNSRFYLSKHTASQPRIQLAVTVVRVPKQPKPV